jgi:hypothetical protein
MHEGTVGRIADKERMQIEILPYLCYYAGKKIETDLRLSRSFYSENALKTRQAPEGL